MNNKEQIISRIENEKLIVIVRGVKSDKLIPFAKALYDGGIRLIEITYSADGKTSDEQTAEEISLLSKEFEGKMLVGAGTVLTKKQVELTLKAGGKFIVSPCICDKVIKKCNKLNMPCISGALTPTEIQTAYEIGADFIKLFPSNVFSADYVKAVKTPLSHVKLLAFGGVDTSNLQDYLDAGITGFGVGADIVKKDLIEKEDWAGITALANKYVQALKG